MNVAAYIHTERLAKPTGVGQHIIHMINGLSRLPGMQINLLLPRDASLNCHPDLPLADLPTLPLPFSRKILERFWLMTSQPKIDRWCGGADWLYLPMEAYVPTKKIPVALTVHDMVQFETGMPWANDPVYLRFQKNWRLKFSKIRRHTKLFLAVSQFTKDRMTALLDVDPRQIEVVGNGVADVYFSAPAEPISQIPPPCEGPFLIVVGGLLEKKGAEYVLQFAKLLFQKMPEFRIVVTGRSYGDYPEKASAIGNIIFVDYVTNIRQIELLRQARALLFLSRYEGFGIPALEAMAVGTPAIVSSFGALPEICGDAGVVVNVEDPNDILQGLDRLESDPSFRAQLIAKGRSRAEQFRWPQAVARLFDALQRHL
jgi:glycosyltransferase involved in cell wall biosynthesis